MNKKILGYYYVYKSIIFLNWKNIVILDIFREIELIEWIYIVKGIIKLVYMIGG